MNGFSILLGAVAGAIGAAAGTLVATLLKSEAAKRTVVAVATVASVAASIAIRGPLERWWDDAAASSLTGYDRFNRTYEKLARKDEAFMARMRSMVAPGTSAEETFARGRLQGARGLRRLSDADLAERSAYLTRGIAALDVARCAGLARGTAGVETVAAIVNTLAPEEADAFATIVLRGARAELFDDPPARPDSTPADLQRIVASIAERAPASDIQSIQVMFAPGATDADVCAGLRILYARLPELPPAEQSRLALILSGM